MINVTKTFFPPLDEYQAQLQRIWNNQWLTNRGELVLELEGKLKNYLSVDHILVTNNGTIPIQIALKLLGNGGEIITTPFSYVATSAAIVWENCTPVFVDIDPEYLTIDETRIEAAITDKTTCILATHVFGNPCHVEVIEAIAQKHNLKVIYDAAHAFDVKYKDKSLLSYGDISTLSFHATKLFHTIEGGALIINDDSLLEKVRYLINFGIKNQEEIPHLGTNAKMNEFEAAMGLCILDDIEDIKTNRKKVVENYKIGLESLVTFQEQNNQASENYSYFPILFKNEEELSKVQKSLNKENIFPRRYFYPSLDTLEYIEPKQECKISRAISKRVLCLPLYAELEKDNQDKIIDIIRKCY